jgi:hypothetical protein
VGYFAVLKPVDATAGADFDVTRCHINVWVLPSFIPGRRLMYFDLGIELTAIGADPVNAVEVLLPFLVEPGYKMDQFRGCADLYDKLFDDETAELIFGEPVEVSGAAEERTLTVQAGEYIYRPRRIDTAHVEAAKDQPPRSSCYRVPLQNSVAPNASAYVRLRFRVFGNRSLLSAKSPFGGVILDFRIADVRESRTRRQEVGIRKRIVPIMSVNFFAMLPSQYQMITASPSQRYMRVLETRAWSKYLAGVAYRHPSNAQVVYYWRSEKRNDGGPVPITPDNPFRVFANYDRHLNKARTLFWFLMALLAVMIVARSGWMPAISAANAKSLRTHAFGFSGLATAAGIITFGKLLHNAVINHFAKPRLAFRWIERLLLGLRI